jgi:hypothetical protein
VSTVTKMEIPFVTSPYLTCDITAGVTLRPNQRLKDERSEVTEERTGNLLVLSNLHDLHGPVLWILCNQTIKHLRQDKPARWSPRALSCIIGIFKQRWILDLVFGYTLSDLI